MTSVPVRAANSFMLVPVTVDGVPTNFVLDTGATHIMVSRDFADQIGLSARARPTTVPIETYTPKPMLAQYAPLKSFKLGSLRMQGGGDAVLLDLSDVSALAGERVDGLVGNGLLGSADYVLNVGKSNLRMAKRIDLSGDPQALPLRTSNYRTYLPATINGRSFEFLLDTGSNATFLSPESFAAIGGADADVVELSAMTLSGVETKQFRRVRAVVTLGQVTARDFVLLVGDQNVIGLDLLRFGELSVSGNQGRFAFRKPNELEEK